MQTREIVINDLFTFLLKDANRVDDRTRQSRRDPRVYGLSQSRERTSRFGGTSTPIF